MLLSGYGGGHCWALLGTGVGLPCTAVVGTISGVSVRVHDIPETLRYYINEE